MATPSHRRVSATDHPLIEQALTGLVDELKRKPRKALYNYLDVPTAMRSMNHLDAHIVADSYLVVTDVSSPWFSQDLFLHELLVLRLKPGAPFEVVPRFLGHLAREAGAKLAAAGTALAKSDAALASLYQRSGFEEAARTLVMEVNP